MDLAIGSILIDNYWTAEIIGVDSTRYRIKLVPGPSNIMYKDIQFITMPKDNEWFKRPWTSTDMEVFY